MKPEKVIAWTILEANCGAQLTDFQGGPRTLGDSDRPADPLGTLFSILQDNWRLGISEIEKMFAQGAGASPDDTQGPPVDASKVEIASLITQSYLIAATSSLRYLSRVAETFSTHQSSLMSSVLGEGANRKLSEEDRRAVTENIRACLREIGDLAEQEVRLFQAELGQVGEALASASDHGATTRPYRRRWKTKP